MTEEVIRQAVDADAWVAFFYAAVATLFFVATLKAGSEYNKDEDDSGGYATLLCLVFIVTLTTAIYNSATAIHLFIAPEHEVQVRLTIDETKEDNLR